MNLSATVTPPVGTHKWRLVYKQLINENIVKHRRNNIKYIFIEVIITNKYCTLINNQKCPYSCLQLHCSVL